ncbi:hypothetical protein JYU34_009285 [Plutella xylostella]|uniref:Uncharacterized protein n=1 Tax=Plutella xylostella TaxID=51655 RepID=A0ABQ7QJ37_PLUXY|nr:hypothetical protein JYU34_009285 [Plutella xylostella]
MTANSSAAMLQQFSKLEPRGCVQKFDRCWCGDTAAVVADVCAPARRDGRSPPSALCACANIEDPRTAWKDERKSFVM